MSVPDAWLGIRSVTRRFGGITALHDVSLDVRAGRVHALLGENGAGKSTVVNCLSGVLRPSAGDIFIDGEVTRLDNPAIAHRHGIRTIHQELELASPLSVLENLLLGQLPGRAGIVRRSLARRTAEAALHRLGVQLPLDVPVESLDIADRQLIEIARALIADARLIIMDEPTAALPPSRIDGLLQLVRRVRDDGVAILYVSHRLDEVLSIADDITVLRNGRVSASLDPERTTKAELVRAIVGRDVTAQAGTARASGLPEAIRLHSLSVGPVTGLDAHVAQGEVVGFFGLLGAGQQSVAETLYGLRRPEAGSIRILDRQSAPASPARAARMGIGYVPADRKEAGLALTLSISDNLFIGRRGRGRFGLTSPRRERRAADELLELAGVAAAGSSQHVGELSGGNQQKVVLARWQSRSTTKILLLEEPTRGVDIGAKSDIHQRLRHWARTGNSVALFSTDPEETVALCDRVYVLARGRLVAELSGLQLNEDSLTAAALSD